MRKNQHVVPNGEKWAVKGAGNTKATRLTETQGKALQIARKIARNQGVDVVIHGKDGKIRDVDSYGHDPSPPRDLKH